MSVALDLARLGLGRTSPNPAVGSVVVQKGEIIGRGFHRGPGFPHAEIEALRAAQKRGATPSLKGATLYITLEPCCPPKRGGRTPPCTDAILKSGIRSVVIGMRDPDPRMAGRGIRLLRKAGLKVRVGVLERECRDLGEAYIVHRTEGRPFVILKMATTADGKVGIRGRRVKITGAEADRRVHALRDRVDAILVGVGTVRADNPRLTTRLKGRKGRDPVRVILDSRLRISPRARVFKIKSDAPTWIATAARKNHPKAVSLSRRATLLFTGKDARGRVDLRSLLRELGRRGIVSLLVEGGPRVWASFLKQKAVDRLLLFVAPTTLGSRGVPALIHSSGSLPYALTSVARLGRDLLLEGVPS